MTGKSVSDNALSLATNMDCKAHNLLYGEAICNEKLEKNSLENNKNMTLAKVQHTAKSETNASEATVDQTINSAKLAKVDRLLNARVQQYLMSNVVTATSFISAAELLKTEVSASGNEKLRQNTERFNQSATKITNKPSLYAVVGSFNELSHARFRKNLYNDFNAVIREHETPDGSAYRVIIGPLSGRDEISEIPQQVDTERADPWLISLCENGKSLPPCKDSNLQPQLLAKTSNTSNFKELD